tara:strand:- start:7700 stop:8182 length:483 start_codon:yes stop_codon:yes gene_type:complete
MKKCVIFSLNLEIDMIYLVFYFILLVLFVIFWLTYIPRYSFIHYIRNLNTNFSREWKLYKINTDTDTFSYFILINENLDEIILFEYDHYYQELYTKDSRIKTYQEQKILTNIIKKEYNEYQLNRAEKINQEKFEKLKENCKKSYYFISGYDFQIPIKIKI